MLEFGENQVEWANIAHVTVTGSTVTVTDTDNVTLTVGVYENAAKATKIKDLIEAGREAVTIGGVTIVIIIDDL